MYFSASTGEKNEPDIDLARFFYSPGSLGFRGLRWFRLSQEINDFLCRFNGSLVDVMQIKGDSFGIAGDEYSLVFRIAAEALVQFPLR